MLQVDLLTVVYCWYNMCLFSSQNLPPKNFCAHLNFLFPPQTHYCGFEPGVKTILAVLDIREQGPPSLQGSTKTNLQIKEKL